MSHSIPQEDLSAYLDEALPEGRRAQIDAQLAGSPEARADLDSLRWARAFLRAAPPPLPPAGADFRVPIEDDVSLAADGRAGAGRLGRAAWGLGAVAAAIVLTISLRGMGARNAAVPALHEAAGEAGALSMSADMAAADASPSSEDLESIIGAAGTQSVDEARGPTVLAPLATARGADRARVVRGRPTDGRVGAGTAQALSSGSEPGGYVPPEAGLSGLSPEARQGADILDALAAAPPRATATALALARDAAAALLTAAPPDADLAVVAATLVAAETAVREAEDLLAEPTEGAAIRAAKAPVPTRAPAPTMAASEPTAASSAAGEARPTAGAQPLTAATATAAPAAAGTAAPARLWVPLTALSVALLAMGILLLARSGRRRVAP